MAKRKIFEPIEIVTMTLGLLIGIFMLIFILGKAYWALYIEIALIMPFWACVTAIIVINAKEKKNKNAKNKN